MRLQDIFPEFTIIGLCSDKQVGDPYRINRTLDFHLIGKSIAALAVKIGRQPVTSLQGIPHRPPAMINLEQKGVAFKIEAIANMQGRQLGHGLQATIHRHALKVRLSADPRRRYIDDARHQLKVLQPTVNLYACHGRITRAPFCPPKPKFCSRILPGTARPPGRK